MQCATYTSPLGNILLTADHLGLTGLWFEGGKYHPSDSEPATNDLPVFDEAKKWLKIYFSGGIPDFTPPLHVVGSAFQMKVWGILQQIPYGAVMTYGEIAQKIAKEMNLRKMSAQAVGGAVGRNKIAIIIPCHRVIGTNGNLRGYAAGIDKKLKLLQIEGNRRR